MIHLETRSVRIRRGSRLCDLGPGERARYYGWWRQYNLLRRTAAFGLFAVCVFLLLELIENPLGSVAKILLWPALFIAIAAGVRSSFLDCPRCSERFHAGGENPLDDECQNCGLTHRELSAVAKPREPS
jgi:hypothetical protein